MSLLERGQSPITVLGSGGASPARHAPKFPRPERAASTRKSAASARTQKGGSVPMPSRSLTSPARTAAPPRSKTLRARVSVAFASSGLRLLLPVGIRQGRGDEEWRQGISCRGCRSTPPGGQRFPLLACQCALRTPRVLRDNVSVRDQGGGSPGRAVGSHPSPLSACAFQRFQTVKERALGEAH
jgi:hypothetical protein